MPERKAEVIISRNDGVPDQLGEAFLAQLKQLGFPVESVRTGKLIQMVLDTETRPETIEQVRAIIGEVLANPVIEHASLITVGNAARGSRNKPPQAKAE